MKVDLTIPIISLLVALLTIFGLLLKYYRGKEADFKHFESSIAEDSERWRDFDIQDVRVHRTLQNYRPGTSGKVTIWLKTRANHPSEDAIMESLDGLADSIQVTDQVVELKMCKDKNDIYEAFRILDTDEITEQIFKSSININ